MGKKDLKKMDWNASLGRLMGILLHGGTEAWIADNEVWEEEKKFTKWFADYSQAWKEVLKRSDEELGLALEGGREGGYRNTLVKMIRRWQKETNQLLDDIYNGKNNHNFKVKVDITKSEEEEEESDGSENESDAAPKASKRKAKDNTKGKSKVKKVKTAEVKSVSAKKKSRFWSDQTSSGSK